MMIPRIHVTWPPGCYGSYIMQSIYAYSNLSSNYELIIDHTGSSHTFRNSEAMDKHFSMDHLLSDNSDIIISSVTGHELDYFVNQFVKQSEGDVSEYLESLFPNFKWEIKKQWNKEELWTTREYISCWIQLVLAVAYKNNINASITTDKLFDENKDIFPAEISRLIQKLGLSVVVDDNIIETNHSVWQKQQQYHNLQKRCDKWIDDIVTTRKNTTSPCLTIVDEAYVQNCLRSLGYEIRCFKLNNFPKTSNELRSLLYKEMQDDIAKSENC